MRFYRLEKRKNLSKKGKNKQIKLMLDATKKKEMKCINK